MEIQIYKTSSDVRQVNKFLSAVTTVNAVMLESTNISTPTIILETFEEFADVNYFYIPKFKRYYFLSSAPTVMTGNRVSYNLRCDVLMSFASGIYNVRGIVNRSNSAGNVLINDSAVSKQADSIQTNLAFSGCEFGVTSSLTRCFLLNTFGGVTSEL